MLQRARPRPSGQRPALLIAVATPALLLAGAIGSQLFAGLIPCDMCVWQRWPHAAALLLALLAIPMNAARRPLIILAALAIAISGAIGFYHAGVELGWFPGLTTCSTNSGSGLDAIMSGQIVRCDAVQWEFLTISMAGWNAILSLSAAASIIYFLTKGRR